MCMINLNTLALKQRSLESIIDEMDLGIVMVSDCDLLYDCTNILDLVKGISIDFVGITYADILHYNIKLYDENEEVLHVVKSYESVPIKGYYYVLDEEENDELAIYLAESIVEINTSMDIQSLEELIIEFVLEYIKDLDLSAI